MTRAEAEELSRQYYDFVEPEQLADPMDARAIRRWAESAFSTVETATAPVRAHQLRANIIDPAVARMERRIRVLPAPTSREIRWIDPAGYHIATSSLDDFDWSADSPTFLDFTLDPPRQVVLTELYF